MTDVQLEPWVFDAGQGALLHGVRLSGQGRMRVLFLHDQSADLDSVLPLMRFVGLPEADKFALDLPGHGLSTEMEDPAAALFLACEALSGADAPLLVVACGSSSPLGWNLAQKAGSAGLCLVAPDCGDLIDDTLLRCPVLTFLPSFADAQSEWRKYKARLRARWLEVSMVSGLEEMLQPVTGDYRQVASHLQGFARELFVQSHLTQTVFARSGS